MKYPVGHTWQSARQYDVQDRTIVDVMPHPATGEMVYVVQSPGQGNFANLITEDKIEAEMARDEQLILQAQRNKLQAMEAKRLADERQAAQKEHDSWFGFTDNLPPMKKGKVLAVLNKKMTLNRGEIEERGMVVAFLVRQGRQVKTRSDGIRYLVSDDGLYLSEKDITKIGMDFAEFLLRST